MTACISTALGIKWLSITYRQILRPKKLLHAVADDGYKQSLHELHETHKLAEEVCRYDLDHLDEVWLKSYNDIREQCGRSFEY